jgi:hypothetical protein
VALQIGKHCQAARQTGWMMRKVVAEIGKGRIRVVSLRKILGLCLSDEVVE